MGFKGNGGHLVVRKKTGFVAIIACFECSAGFFDAVAHHQHRFIVRVIAQDIPAPAIDLAVQARFLFQLPEAARFRRFIHFQEPARQAPLPHFRFRVSLDQQNLVFIVKHHRRRCRHWVLVVGKVAGLTKKTLPPFKNFSVSK